MLLVLLVLLVLLLRLPLTGSNGMASRPLLRGSFLNGIGVVESSRCRDGTKDFRLIVEFAS